MNIKERINLLASIGNYLLSDDEELKLVKEKARLQNAWFTKEFVDLSIKNIVENFLQKNLLEDWVNQYQINTNHEQPKAIGIVMAGNIPLVGFHDFLCVFICGHKAIIKLSSKDEVLIKHIGRKIFEWNDEAKDYIFFAKI